MSLMSRLALAALLFLPAGMATAQSAPQAADCSRATQPVDRAICTTPDLRRLDQSIVTAYRRLLADLDRNGAAALRDDQRVFINARNRAAAGRTGAELITELRGWLEQRAKTLNSLLANPNDGLVGHWVNINGEIDVVQWASGVLTFNANAVDPLGARWVCDADGDGEWTGENEGTLEVKTGEDTSRWSLVISRKGDTLQVQERHVSGDRSIPYCGFNGSLSGTYFRVDPLTLERN